MISSNLLGLLTINYFFTIQISKRRVWLWSQTQLLLYCFLKCLLKCLMLWHCYVILNPTCICKKSKSVQKVFSYFKDFMYKYCNFTFILFCSKMWIFLCVKLNCLFWIKFPLFTKMACFYVMCGLIPSLPFVVLLEWICYIEIPSLDPVLNSYSSLFYDWKPP